MKVLGLVTSASEASARVRIIQYKSPLTTFDIKLSPKYYNPLRYSPPSQWSVIAEKVTRISKWRYYQLHRTISRLPLFIQQHNYDLLWLNRLIIHHQSFYERKLSKPFVFDFDDAIWLNDNPVSVNNAIQRAAMVFAGNEYLADYASRYNKNTVVIPTVIDTTSLFPIANNHNMFTIGWSGTFTNFKYLDIVKPAIHQFLKSNSDARFMVISSEEPPGFLFDDKQYIFKKWSAEAENELLNEFDVGIMPLEDDDFTKGKCSYKMLQYMACSKPVIVSPVGTNAKILSEGRAGFGASSNDEWIDAFSRLKNDKAQYEECSVIGREVVEKKYSVSVTTPTIADYFKKICNYPSL